MLTIFLCLIQSIVPNFPAYMAEVEVRAAVFATGLFVFLLGRLWRDSRTGSERALPRVERREGVSIETNAC